MSWLERLSAVAVIVVLFFVAAVVYHKTSLASPTPVSPAQVFYRECPYCDGVFVVVVDQKLHAWRFVDHDYVHLPVTPSGAYYETCAAVYWRDVPEAVKRLRELGHGRLVEATK